MADIQLSLNIERASFVRAESIPFEVVLENSGNETVTLQDFSPANQSVTLAASTGNGDPILGTQISWRLRNGDRYHEPREYSTFELAPGEARSLRGDALAWLGVLPPGDYEFYAAYNSGMSVYAETDRISVTIVDSDPVSHRPVLSPGSPAYALVPVSWHNRSENGTTLFLLETSPHYPPNYFRSLEIEGTEGLHATFPATTIRPDEPVRHVVWVTGDGALMVAGRNDAGEVLSPVSHNLNLAEGEILHPPLSDPDGVLHVAVVDRLNGEVLHIAVRESGPSVKRIVRARPDPKTYSLVWGRDQRGYFLWRTRNGRDLHLATFPFAGQEGDVEIRDLPEVSGTVRAVSVFQKYDTQANVFINRAYLLAEVDEPERVWMELLVDLSSGETLRSRPLAVRDQDRRPYDVVLGRDETPEYLFSDGEERVWFYQDDEAGLIPVIDGNQRHVTAASAPRLYPTSAVSKKGRLYLGYLHEDSGGRELRFLELRQ